MRTFIVLCLVAAAVAGPPASSNDAQVLRYDNDVNSGPGDFKYSWEQSDGSKAEAQGQFQPGSGKDNEGAVVITGSYEYVGADGVTYTVRYVADENGYHPTLSQGPNGAIPDEIIKAFSRK